MEEKKAKELGIPYYEFQTLDELEFLFKATEFRL